MNELPISQETNTATRIKTDFRFFIRPEYHVFRYIVNTPRHYTAPPDLELTVFFTGTKHFRIKKIRNSLKILKCFPRNAERNMSSTEWKSSETLWFKEFKTEFAEEAKVRSAEFANNLYVRRRNIPVVATIVSIALALVTILIVPPRDIAIDINSQASSFQQFKNGRVYFSNESSPPKDDQVKHEITLPFRSTSQVPGYNPTGIWFDFNVEIPSSNLETGNLGILIPMVWGKSKIFLNGNLRDFGTNLFVVLPLLQPKNFVQIRSDLTGTGRKNPITSTFPIVVGDIDSLRNLISKVDAQIEANMRSIAIYCLAIIVFGALFLAYPKKPELLAFIVFLATSLINVVLFTANDLNFSLVKSFWPQQTLLVLFDFFSSMSMFVFAMYFLRSHPSKVRDATRTISIVVLSVGMATAYLFFRWTGSSSIRQVAHLAVNLSFFAFQSWYVLPRVLASYKHNSIPKVRKAACILVFATIQVFYVINIFDYFALFTSVTTLCSNGLLLNLALAVTVAFEISRAEHNQVVLGSMLPKEVKEALHHSGRQSEQRGYVILVDAIGYAADRARFEDRESRSTYIDALAQKILQPLNELDLGDLSVLNCTGDGIYCAIRGEANLQGLERAMAFAQHVTRINSNSGVGFRAAIGYGKYGVKVIEVGKMRKEFVAGNVLNDLSRVIPSKGDAEDTRVLISEEIEQFFESSEMGTVIDKHGFQHKFVALEKTKRAA